MRPVNTHSKLDGLNTQVDDLILYRSLVSDLQYLSFTCPNFLMMLLGEDIPPLVDPLMVIVYFFVATVSHGHPSNKVLYVDPLQIEYQGWLML